MSFANFEASDDAIANLDGQYLMNKAVSIQYAYKKDGKGERHGDEAERLLAAQAKRNNVQPVMQPLPPQLFGNQPMGAQTPTMDGDPMRMGNFGGPPPGMIANGRQQVPNGSYPNMGVAPPPPPPRPQGPYHQNQPMPIPPSGLPPRPPPSQAGYGGPQGFVPHGLPQGFGNGPPPGFPPGAPPGLPPGFQPAGMGRPG